MGKLFRSFIQSTLKVVNSILTMVGIAMILYSLWMIKKWHSEDNVSLRPDNKFAESLIQGRPYLGVGSDGHAQMLSADLPPPWFIYTFLGMGIGLCLITCSGHVAAETANGHCLSCYLVFICLLFLLEAGVAANIFFNKNWEEDFPKDPTGQFDQLKNFVRENFDICKWVGVIVLVMQALSILLAMILRALGPDPGRDYDSDDDYVPSRSDLRQPFLNHPASQGTAPLEPRLSQNDAWSIRMREKINR